MQSLTWLSLHPRNTSARALHLLQPRTVTLSKPRLQLLPIDTEGSFLLSRYNPPTQPLLLPTWALSVKAAGRALLYPQPLGNCASLFAERRLHPRTARSLRRSLVLSMQTRLRFPGIAQVSKAQKTQPVSVGVHSLRRTAMWKNLPCHLVRNSCCPSVCYRCHTLFFMSYEKGSKGLWKCHLCPWPESPATGWDIKRKGLNSGCCFLLSQASKPSFSCPKINDHSSVPSVPLAPSEGLVPD